MSRSSESNIRHNINKGEIMENRWETLVMLLSLKALLESDNKEKALEVIDNVIVEMKK